MGGGGGGSQRLLSLNPTTVMVVLLLGLWLLLGCDKKFITFITVNTWNQVCTLSPRVRQLLNIIQWIVKHNEDRH